MATVVSGVYIGAALTVGYMYRNVLWEYAVQTLCSQARTIVHHELHQPHVIARASTGLNNVVERHVLENPAVIRKTSELFRLLFQQERMKKLASDLMCKALQQNPVKDILSKYVLISLNKRADEFFKPERMGEVLVSLRSNTPD